MKAAIIAAGRGERLARGGIPVPKPLLSVGGQPLIARAIRAASRLNVSSVVCIVNDLNPPVADYLRSEPWPLPLEVVVKTTANSMESLFSLAPQLDLEPFFLFTVDSICAPGTLKTFENKALSLQDAQGVLAITTFVDDEKPLWVKVNRRYRILSMGAEAAGSRFVTAGFYFFRPGVFQVMEKARSLKMDALRRFLGLLNEGGYALYGIPVAKTIDIDHPKDIEEAEAYLRIIENR